MTIETLVFLKDLLAVQQISVGAPDFEVAVERVRQAIAELDEAIIAATAEIVE